MIERLERRRLMDAGDLDPAFGTGGELRWTAGENLAFHASAFDVGPSNEIVMAALIAEPGDAVDRAAFISVRVARADGLRDSLFNRVPGSNAEVLIPLPRDVLVIEDLNAFSPPGVELAVGPDGGIFVSVGYRLWKLRADGKLDRGFAHHGHAAFDDFPARDSLSMDVDAQGRLYVLGSKPVVTVATHNTMLFRLKADGSLDETFAGEGIYRLDVTRTSAVKVLRGGDVMVAGSESDFVDTGTFYRAQRLHGDDGSLVTSYGAGGVAEQRLESYDIDITDVGINSITDDGYAVFWRSHDVDRFRYSETTAFDPTGTEILPFLPNNTSGEVLRDDQLFIAAGFDGPTFFDQSGQVIQAPTDHAAAELELANDGEVFVGGVVLQHDGSMLISTYVAGTELPNGQHVNDGYNIRRMFRDDAPILQYTPRGQFSPTEPYVFNVRWLDDDGIGPTTLGDDDITIGLPNGGRKRARLIGNFGGGYHRYAVTGPGGIWDASDNGEYTVRVERRGVRDVDGNATAQRVLGSFRVQIGG